MEWQAMEEPVQAEAARHAPLKAGPVLASASGTLWEIIEALEKGLGPEPMALILLFSEESALIGPLSHRLSQSYGSDCRVLASSSAGGFTFSGYTDAETVIAVAFPAAHFQADAVWLSHLNQHMTLDWMQALRGLSERMVASPDRARFGLLLIDGTSGAEELVTATVDAALPQLLVIGGSAGDGLRFEQTRLAMNGNERVNNALFCIISTDFAVKEVIFDHFVPVGERMIVTAADPAHRLIREINAEPAASEYARLIGLPEAALDTRAFAENPLLERAGGRHFVRAISGVTADGGLSLMSSIEAGAILRLGRPESLTEGLRRRMQQIGPAEFVLGFDCILRRIAIEQAQLQSTVAELCKSYRIAGFNTYGEQHGGIHVNQTFVGLAILSPAMS